MPQTPATSLAASLARYAATGEEEAFAEVVRAAGPLVWRVAMRRLEDAQLAEEAAQNVFITLARKAQAVSARPGALAWLHRAATLEAANLARSHARREHRHRLMATNSRNFPPSPRSLPPRLSTPASMKRSTACLKPTAPCCWGGFTKGSAFANSAPARAKPRKPRKSRPSARWSASASTWAAAA